MLQLRRWQQQAHRECSGQMEALGQNYLRSLETLTREQRSRCARASLGCGSCLYPVDCPCLALPTTASAQNALPLISLSGGAACRYYKAGMVTCPNRRWHA